MKKIILSALFFVFTVVSYASFPIVDTVDPIVSMSSNNWQAWVGLGCAVLAWGVSWLFAIPGVIFSWLGTRGDKEMKWVAWVGYCLNALAITIMSILLNLY